jgi:hypothetical protein
VAPAPSPVRWGRGFFLARSWLRDPQLPVLPKMPKSGLTAPGGTKTPPRDVSWLLVAPRPMYGHATGASSARSL